jgi:lipopolysaccharide export system protein LptA
VTVAENSGAYDADWSALTSPGPDNESDQVVSYVITDVELYGLPSLFSQGPTFTSGGHLTFTPAADTPGLATVTVHLQDGGGLEDYQLGNQLAVPPDDTSDDVTFDIIVTSVPDPDAVADDLTVGEDAGPTPVAVLANDTIVPESGGTLTITGKTNGSKGTVDISGGGTGLTYTPNANANGSDSFTYTISDGVGGTDTAAVSVTITPVNDDPTALADALTVAEDAGATAVAVLTNDSIAPDTGETLTITATTNGTKGTVTITGGGTGLTYTPNANANGSDSFTYTISDGHGGTDTATVAVTITPVNDPPNAVNDGSSVGLGAWIGGGATVLPVLANDTSAPDGPEVLVITAVTQGSLGTIGITGGGTGLTYTPGSATGTDTFTYTIEDGHGGTDTATAQVTVGSVAIDRIWTAREPRRPISRITVTWTIVAGPAGIASQSLQRRVDGGSWTTIASPSATTRAVRTSAAPGHAYQFRVLAAGKAGAVSPWATSWLVPT